MLTLDQRMRIGKIIIDLNSILMENDDSQSADIYPTSGTKAEKRAWIDRHTKGKQILFPITQQRAPLETHIDNSIEETSKLEDFLSNEKEEENLMRLNKGIRRRKDGRYDWRKTIRGISHYLINSDLKELIKQVRQYKKKLADSTNKRTKHVEPIKKKESKKFADLAWRWYELNKKGKIASERQYTARLNNYISKLDKNIEYYTKNDIIEFLNNITNHRTREYCYIIIKNVYAEAVESGLIKRNVISTLKNNRGKATKGLWYTPDEQKKIYENRHMCDIGDEIEFFLMVGCRLSEAFKCTLELDKLRIWVERTKSSGTSGYVNISATYAEYLKSRWHKMFSKPSAYYSKEMKKLLSFLKIPNQKNEKPIHRLRHTFATNLYYFGVNDKKRAYLLGHKSIRITNDVYTDFDLDICKAEIYSIYSNIYPEF